ncbi:MAG: ACP S-malonyltransferase [Candidatus Omnitrophica bacterium]|nr:ACP S-malonyltransferase [Candidatus Omnitrophota bacterium]MCM8799341.1 ACP S-malonyltransferase [Candidatus Omnitrophota bacterium]
MEVGFLFPGQGAQYVGMGKEFYEEFEESKKIFNKAEEILDYDIKKYCFQGPPDLLKQTVICQPAIFTVSIAIFEAFKRRIKILPRFMAGLSLGEYTALVAAESLSFEEGLTLVKKRAEIMEESAKKNPSKMLAVLGLSLDKVSRICEISGAEVANINSSEQIVISGRKDAIDKAKDLSLKEGAKVVELQVSGGFHSSLMLEASFELKRFLDTLKINKPIAPIVSNYTAEATRDPEEIKKNLILQIYSPVRWHQSISFITGRGVKKFIEFGPGKVLKGLLRKIDASLEVVNIETKEDFLNFNKLN